MLVNAYSTEGRAATAPIPGTHILQDDLRTTGRRFRDVENPSRIWTVQALYTPVVGRAVGGVRAKVYDQKDFISFCNQRDLEVLLGIASPGAYCHWLDATYAEPGDKDWIGLGVDYDDLLDDLFDRELEARAMADGRVLPAGLSFERRVHDGANNDYVEQLVLINDMDLLTGVCPDTRMDTIERRWASVERTPQAKRSHLWARL